MLTKGEFLDRLRENPLPEDVISQNSSLICGLFYYYGIHCRADEEAAECFWRGEVSEAVSGGGAGRLWTDCGRSGSGSAACPALQSPGGGFPAGSAGTFFRGNEI